MALSRLWGLRPDPHELNEIATNLGADVPFFLVGGMVLGEGTGTTLSRVKDTSRRYLIIVTPNAEVSSTDAYGALNSTALTTPKSDSILSSSPSGSDFSGPEPSLVFKDLNNDFETVIFDMEPEIGRSKEALLQAGAVAALLAGSGSSVFGVFEDQKQRELAIGKIQLEPGWRVFACDTLSRNEYMRALTVDEISLLDVFNSDSNIGA
jgi:4-diphosphocytidyl-2-C-methyl-D-erythritol kinase